MRAHVFSPSSSFKNGHITGFFIQSVKMKTQKTGPKELPKRFLEDSKKADFLLLSNRKFAPAFKMRLNFFLCKGEEVKLLNNP